MLCAAPTLPVLARPEMRLVSARSVIDKSSASSVSAGRTAPSKPSDRRRATRHNRDAVPWLWSAKLPWGTEVTLVDVSKTGVLVETTSRITLGSTLDLQFLGQNTNVSVPARILRSDVAQVDALGVKYRVAAAFNRDLELLEPCEDASDVSVKPAALAEMLARVLADVDSGSGPLALRARFEDELRKMLPVRNIQIRQSPLDVERRGRLDLLQRACRIRLAGPPGDVRAAQPSVADRVQDAESCGEPCRRSPAIRGRSRSAVHTARRVPVM